MHQVGRRSVRTLHALASHHRTRGRRVDCRQPFGEHHAVRSLDLDGVTFVDNFSDRGLRDIRYWSPDKLHLNALGHARVASNVLTALGVPVPVEWGVEEVAAAPAGPRSRNTAAYYREFVLPWIGRRLTGKSSGDGRTAKRATLLPVEP